MYLLKFIKKRCVLRKMFIIIIIMDFSSIQILMYNIKKYKINIFFNHIRKNNNTKYKHIVPDTYTVYTIFRIKNK